MAAERPGKPGRKLKTPSHLCLCTAKLRERRLLFRFGQYTSSPEAARCYRVNESEAGHCPGLRSPPRRARVERGTARRSRHRGVAASAAGAAATEGPQALGGALLLRPAARARGGGTAARTRQGLGLQGLDHGDLGGRRRRGLAWWPAGPLCPRGAPKLTRPWRNHAKSQRFGPVFGPDFTDFHELLRPFQLPGG